MCSPDLFKRLGLFIKLIFIDIDSKVGYNGGGGGKIVHPIIIFTHSIIEQSLFKMETIWRLENYT